MKSIKYKQKNYQTQRLVLRPLELTDFDAWYRSHDLSMKALDKFDKDPWPKSKRTRTVFRKNVLRQRRAAKKDLQYIWQIFHKKSGELLGWVDVAIIIRFPNQMANLGYFVINTYRKQGYANEALRCVIPRAFKDLRLQRLEASIDLDNRASIRLAKRAGLSREGVKKHYFFQNGRWEDQLIFIATPELYPMRKS